MWEQVKEKDISIKRYNKKCIQNMGKNSYPKIIRVRIKSWIFRDQEALIMIRLCHLAWGNKSYKAKESIPMNSKLEIWKERQKMITFLIIGIQKRKILDTWNGARTLCLFGEIRMQIHSLFVNSLKWEPQISW